MSRKNDTHKKTLRLVQLAFLLALVVVLQLLSTTLARFGLFPLSLVLIPIYVGAMLLGTRASAFLGTAFGIVCFIAGLTGFDAGTLGLIQLNPYYTAIVAIGKGLFAGLASGLVYKLMMAVTKKKIIPSSIISSAVTPIVNTGLYFIGMLAFFNDAFTKDLFIAIMSLNFPIEFALNIIICPIISVILSKNKYFKPMIMR